MATINDSKTSSDFISIELILEDYASIEKIGNLPTQLTTEAVPKGSAQLINKFFMRLLPQIYQLKADDKDGVYFTSTVTLAKQGFSLTLSSIVNNKLQSNITSDDFVWNLSLTYSY